MNLPMILMNVAQETQKTGAWASFVKFLSSILEGLNTITGQPPFGGYGLAIILFTLIMRLVLLPLDIKSRKANQKMQEVQPLLEEIKQKYKNDPDKLNKKTMEIYQKHKINPMGGCLPMLLQMPIFFAMFAALRTISGEQAANAQAFLWIKNIWLPQSPLINSVGESIAIFGPNFNGLFILPIVAGISSYYQMKLTQPKGGNQQMKGFTAFMPLMSVWFCASSAAAFAVYWVTSNAYQIIQSLILKRNSDLKVQGERKGD